MRLKPASYLAAGLLSLPVPGLYAQAPVDASDRYLSVYTSFQRGEGLEGGGKYAEALAAFKEASQLLNAIATEAPTWNPIVVDFRRKRINEAITRLQAKVGQSGGEATTGSQGGRGPRSGAPRPTDDLPLPDSEDLPPILGESKPDRTMRPKPSGSDSRSPIQAIQSQMDALQEDIRKANEEKLQIQRERDGLLKRVTDADARVKETDRQMKILEERSKNAEDKLLGANTKGAENAEKVQVLQADSAKLKKQMAELEIQRAADEELRQQATSRIRATTGNVRSLTEALAAERKRADSAEKKANDAIADATKKMEAAIKERDTLIVKLQKTEAERDAAQLQVSQMKEAQKNVDKLVADNASLMAKLDKAEKQITQITADNKQKDVLIADLTKQVGAVKEELSKAQKESASYQKQMSELQARLETTSKQLNEKKSESAASAAEKKRVSDENELLRNIVLRQMKKQADRDQTRKLVLGEMAKMEIKSKDLLDKIKYLGEPVVVLSPKERALFKKPQVEIGDNEISIAAAKQEITEEAAPAPAVPEPTEETAAPATSTSLTPPLPSHSPDTAARASSPSKPASGATPAPLPPVTNRTPTKQEAPVPDLASLDLKGLNAPAPQPELPKSPSPATTGKPAPTTSGGVTESSTSPSTVPAELQPMAQEAKDQFDRGNYRDAERLYDKILSKSPGNLYALSNLGVVRFREGKLKLAEEAFRKAVAIAPEDAFSRCTLGIIYYSQSRYDDAVTELTKSLAINPRYAAAHNFLGITASQKGWQEAAQKELETAVNLDPNYADAHFNLAVVYATQQPADKEKARNNYKRAMELGADADPSLEGLLK